MRKTKVKFFKKQVIASIAVLLLGSGAVFADEWTDPVKPDDEFVATWDDIQTQANTGLVKINNIKTYQTNGSPLNLTAPPVPDAVTITGRTVDGSYSTFDANGSGTILTNSVNTVITDVNLKNANGEDVNGGAIQNTGVLTIRSTGSLENAAEVSNNTVSGNGGAMYNSGAGILNIENIQIRNNLANKDSSGESGFGGAIYNDGQQLNITNASFETNDSTAIGGAIANWGGTAKIQGTKFLNNMVSAGTGQGGAIANAATMNISGGSYFWSNTAKNFGGAIANSLGTSSSDSDQDGDIVLTIRDTTFVSNLAEMGGGAIYNTGSANECYNIVNINEGVVFENNGAAVNPEGDELFVRLTGNGGAISNSARTNKEEGRHDGILNILGTKENNVVFKSNIAVNGGAIKNSGIANIQYAKFENNGQNYLTGTEKAANGGAIFNESDTTAGTTATTVISNSSFINNIAANGGAIYNSSGRVDIIDSDFVGNKANSIDNGGAVYGSSNSQTILRAHGADMNVGNADSLANGTDSIRLAGSANVALQASEGRNLNIYSNVVGSSNSTLAINNNYAYPDEDGTLREPIASKGTVRFVGDAQARNTHIALYDGTLAFDHDRSLGSTDRADSNNRLSLYGGTLDLLNNEFGPNQLVVQELNLLGNTNIKLDVDLGGQYTGGTPAMDALLDGNLGTVTVDPNAYLTITGMKSVSEATDPNTTILFTNSDPLIGHVQLAEGANIIEAPINKYEVTQVTIPTTGGPAGSMDPGEYFQFTKIGNSDSIITGPVAAQAAFLLMDNIYRQSFANMDMVTMLTPEQRMAWKMKNKYADAAYHRGVYAPNVIPEERDAWYLRPFANFENVPLKNGPKVSNVFYGSLIGGQSDLIELGHGWDGTFSFFGAYHGSHQAYNGTSIWQNGGSLGGVATAYKGNFWTGITANVGASAAQSSHAFGSENFPILMTGAAWKSGYNWGLFNNKFIIQPSYMMSYTFVNVFDYTNGAGVRVTQDPLNAIEIIPGLRLIGNLKNGWQPYLGVNMTWNIMDKTKFYANEVALTQLSVKPFVEYGAGIQKRYGDRFTGFGQAMLRNGGRNGIAFTVGLRWALGN